MNKSTTISLDEFFGNTNLYVWERRSVTSALLAELL